jgi:hypothetical protein
VILGVFLAEPTKRRSPPMALDQSVLSELLDAFRTGEGLDLIKEAQRAEPGTTPLTVPV